MKDLRSLDLAAMQNLATELLLPKFRAEQLFKWIHQKWTHNIFDMSNLPKSLQEHLEKEFFIAKSEIVDKKTSSQSKTTKYLLRFDNDIIIESVLMEHSYGTTLCVSSQDGCRMSCQFCESTKSGLKNNLTAGQMLSQVYDICEDSQKRISHIVVMGMGEPLDNFENVLNFIKILSSESAYNISGRNITLSTCGLVPEINRLADENLQLTLAVSLHAPNDKLRQSLMPIAKKHSINDIVKACTSYFGKTKRRISFEYILFDGINDSAACARELAGLMRSHAFHVNLIEFNETSGNQFAKSSKKNVRIFTDILQSNNIEFTIRKSLGSDIFAACGQLRRRNSNLQ